MFCLNRAHALNLDQAGHLHTATMIKEYLIPSQQTRYFDPMLFNVGPSSTTLAQHKANNRSTSRITGTGIPLPL